VKREPMTEPDMEQVETPAEALRLLIEGNERFNRGERLHPHQDADRRQALAPGQRPFAVLFGCSDSRLAAEIIFDRGLGDLFVVRTAGHVVGPEVLGSIEYAVAALDTPLIAVLGHDSCGAIMAALDAVRDGTTPSGFIRDVVERVMLSVLTVRDRALADSEVAVEEHVRYTVDLLAERSALIAERLAEGRVGVVGLSYRLGEGSVHQVASRGL
jgi:carbonic anhydrase